MTRVTLTACEEYNLAQIQFYGSTSMSMLTRREPTISYTNILKGQNFFFLQLETNWDLNLFDAEDFPFNEWNYCYGIYFNKTILCFYWIAQIYTHEKRPIT